MSHPWRGPTVSPSDNPWHIIFMGTPEFAVPSLEALLRSPDDVVAVISQPDRAVGRGRHLTPPAVKKVAIARGVPVLQPPTLRGVWDRAPSFLHDGRARTLREALLPPNHPALQNGEHGFNERDGFPNTHGSTSQLTEAEVADLIAFLLSL